MADQLRAEDVALADGALRGDEDALGRLLARDQEWAYNVAYRVLGQEADARDAVQDAFLLTVRAMRGDGSPPRTGDSFRPWLRRVVTNSALTQVRRRPAAPVVPVEDVADSLPVPDHTGPEHLAEREETRGQVLQVLLTLPETQRVALALREYLNASYDEIGETLGIPTTAVGTLLFRARAGFRAAYDRVTETSRPITCPDLVPLFSTIVDGQDRPSAWNELEEHLRTCEHCQSELEGQRRARRLYALVPLLALPAGWDPVVQALSAATGGAVAGAAATGGAAASDAAVGSADAAAAPVEGSAAAGSATDAAASTVPSDAAQPSGTGASASGEAASAAGASAGGSGASAGSTGASGGTAEAAASGPAAGASAGATGAAASGTGAAASASGVAATTAVGGAATTTAAAGGGLLAGVSAVKLGIAGVVAATAIGAAVVAGPLLAPSPDPAPSPTTSQAQAGTPAPAASASPLAGAVGSPGAAAPAPAAATTPEAQAPAGQPSPSPAASPAAATPPAPSPSPGP